MKLKRILLIDNSDIDNFINTTLLRDSGIVEEITSFESAAEGLEYLTALADQPHALPQLILLDLGMQLMDGFEFLDEFAKLPATVMQRSKIIVLTSSIDPRDRIRSKQYAYVIDLMEKPLRIDRLQKLIAASRINNE